MKFLAIIILLGGSSVVNALNCYSCEANGEEVTTNPCYNIDDDTHSINHCQSCTSTFTITETSVNLTRGCSMEPIVNVTTPQCVPAGKNGKFCKCFTQFCNNDPAALPVFTKKSPLPTIQSTTKFTIQSTIQSTTEEASTASGSSIVGISSLTLLIGVVLARLSIFQSF